MGLNKRFGSKQIVVILVLAIVILLVLNQLYGLMKGRTTDENNSEDLRDKKLSTSIAQVSDSPTATPTAENANYTNTSFKLTQKQIIDLVSRGIINDSKYSAKRVNYGDNEYYTKTTPSSIFFKSTNSLKEEMFF